MATYIDALNGDHTDGSEQFPQMDSVKREDLAELIADRLLEYADMKDLEQFYWNAQYEWATDISEEELLETAERLNIEI